MPIVLIRQMSPLTVEVKDDNGNLLGKMTVPAADATTLNWEVRKAQNRPNGRFKMQDRKIELATVKGGGPPRDQRQEEGERH